MTVRQLNSRIFPVLRSDKSYSLLEKISGYSEIGWSNGGCLILSQVLSKMVPKSKIMMVWNNKIKLPDHCFISIIDEWLLDENGIQSKKMFLKRWPKNMLHPVPHKYLSIKPLNLQECRKANIPICPNKGVKTIHNFFIRNELEWIKDLPEILLARKKSL